jgi:hypothetical protein
VSMLLWAALVCTTLAGTSSAQKNIFTDNRSAAETTTGRRPRYHRNGLCVVFQAPGVTVPPVRLTSAAARELTYRELNEEGNCSVQSFPPNANGSPKQACSGSQELFALNKKEIFIEMIKSQHQHRGEVVLHQHVAFRDQFSRA